MKMAAIQVIYKNCDGYHVFKSEQLKELCVASKDPEVAYRDVAASIKLILKLTQGIECEVEPMQSFTQFVAENVSEDQDQAPVPPQNYFSDIFRVYACA